MGPGWVQSGSGVARIKRGLVEIRRDWSWAHLAVEAYRRGAVEGQPVGRHTEGDPRGALLGLRTEPCFDLIAKVALLLIREQLKQRHRKDGA